jgi:hypothetical protein
MPYQRNHVILLGNLDFIATKKKQLQQIEQTELLLHSWTKSLYHETTLPTYIAAECSWGIMQSRSIRYTHPQFNNS